MDLFGAMRSLEVDLLGLKKFVVDFVYEVGPYRVEQFIV